MSYCVAVFIAWGVCIVLYFLYIVSARWYYNREFKRWRKDMSLDKGIMTGKSSLASKSFTVVDDIYEDGETIR